MRAEDAPDPRILIANHYDDGLHLCYWCVTVLHFPHRCLKQLSEHMEDDDETSKVIPPWVELEYAVCKPSSSSSPFTLSNTGIFPTFFISIMILNNNIQHMRLLAGPSAQIHFTHLSTASASSLTAACSSESGADSSIKAKASFHTTSLIDLMKEKGVPLEKVCLLDPKAENELSPEDKELFDWFLFGVRMSSHPRLKVWEGGGEESRRCYQ